MQKQRLKLKMLNFKLRFLVFSFQLLAILLFCGCSVVSPYTWAEQKEIDYSEGLSSCYDRTGLKKSGAHEVLAAINKPGLELLSQSRGVVASSGQSKEGYKSWFNIVAFDENKLTAKRKYFFLVDEKVKRLPGRRRRFLMEPKRGLIFDSEMVLEAEVLDRPYASENARQIAILKQVLRNLRKDIDEISQGVDKFGSDNKMLAVSGLLLNQVFGTILYTLDSSPAQASMLIDGRGIEFDHINFDKGKIRMVVEDDIATVKIRLGVFMHIFPEQD